MRHWCARGVAGTVFTRGGPTSEQKEQCLQRQLETVGLFNSSSGRVQYPLCKAWTQRLFLQRGNLAKWCAEWCAAAGFLRTKTVQTSPWQSENLLLPSLFHLVQLTAVSLAEQKFPALEMFAGDVIEMRQCISTSSFFAPFLEPTPANSVFQTKQKKTPIKIARSDISYEMPELILLVYPYFVCIVLMHYNAIIYIIANCFWEMKWFCSAGCGPWPCLLWKVYCGQGRGIWDGGSGVAHSLHSCLVEHFRLKSLTLQAHYSFQQILCVMQNMFQHSLRFIYCFCCQKKEKNWSK